MQAEHERRPEPVSLPEHVTVRDAGNSLRHRLEIEGARLAYLQNCESMQRIHVDPGLGQQPVARVTTAQVEALARAMLAAGRSTKTVRNVLSFFHSIFEEAARWAGWPRMPCGALHVRSAGAR